MPENSVPPFKSNLYLLEKALNYQFKNIQLLEQALTRKSAINERLVPKGTAVYKALEDVGDSTLNNLIKTELSKIARFKNDQAMRHQEYIKFIRNGDVEHQEGSNLWRIAKHLHIDIYIIAEDWRKRPERIEKKCSSTKVTRRAIKKTQEGILADHLEALIGAVWLDCGESYETLKRVFLPFFEKLGLNDRGAIDPNFGVSDSNVNLNNQNSFAYKIVGDIPKCYEKILRKGSIAPMDYKIDAQTLLHFFVAHNDLTAVTKLLDEYRCKYEIDKKPFEGREETALHIAIEQEYYDIASLLLDQGANLKEINHTQRTGIALFFAGRKPANVLKKLEFLNKIIQWINKHDRNLINKVESQGSLLESLYCSDWIDDRTLMQYIIEYRFNMMQRIEPSEYYYNSQYLFERLYWAAFSRSSNEKLWQEIIEQIDPQSLVAPDFYSLLPQFVAKGQLRLLDYIDSHYALDYTANWTQEALGYALYYLQIDALKWLIGKGVKIPDTIHFLRPGSWGVKNGIGSINLIIESLSEGLRGCKVYNPSIENLADLKQKVLILLNLLLEQGLDPNKPDEHGVIPVGNIASAKPFELFKEFFITLVLKCDIPKFIHDYQWGDSSGLTNFVYYLIEIAHYKAIEQIIIALETDTLIGPLCYQSQQSVLNQSSKQHQIFSYLLFLIIHPSRVIDLERATLILKCMFMHGLSSSARYDKHGTISSIFKLMWQYCGKPFGQIIFDEMLHQRQTFAIEDLCLLAAYNERTLLEQVFEHYPFHTLSPEQQKQIFASAFFIDHSYYFSAPKSEATEVLQLLLNLGFIPDSIMCFKLNESAVSWWGILFYAVTHHKLATIFWQLLAPQYQDLFNITTYSGIPSSGAEQRRLAEQCDKNILLDQAIHRAILFDKDAIPEFQPNSFLGYLLAMGVQGRAPLHTVIYSAWHCRRSGALNYPSRISLSLAEQGLKSNRIAIAYYVMHHPMQSVDINRLVDDETAFSLAIKFGDEEMVELLLSCQLDLTRRVKWIGENPGSDKAPEYPTYSGLFQRYCSQFKHSEKWLQKIKALEASTPVIRSSRLGNSFWQSSIDPDQNAQQCLTAGDWKMKTNQFHDAYDNYIRGVGFLSCVEKPTEDQQKSLQLLKQRILGVQQIMTPKVSMK